MGFHLENGYVIMLEENSGKKDKQFRKPHGWYTQEKTMYSFNVFFYEVHEPLPHLSAKDFPGDRASGRLP